MSKPLKATVNCDMGEGFSLYTIGDDEGLMKIIHLANIACGFHASLSSAYQLWLLVNRSAQRLLSHEQDSCTR